MSNRVSVLVYSRRVGSPARKAVLVYFAERASDNGEGVWASKSTMAAHTELGRSTVIRIINEFVAEGILIVAGSRKHRNGETIEYAMDLTKISALPSATDNTLGQSQSGTSPGAGPVPERDQSQSGTKLVPERDGYQSQSGTQTITKTIKEPSTRARDVQVASILAEHVGDQTAQDFIAHRKAMKKPLTEKAARLIANKLAGRSDAKAVVEESIMNGWQGIFPERNAPANNNGSNEKRKRWAKY